MTLYALEIPDDPTELAVWLERQLTGFELGKLVAELTAIHCPSRDGPTLLEILGEHRTSVLESGLSGLPTRLIGYLLLRPQLLLDLQELISTSGGNYWATIAGVTPEFAAQIERGRERFERFLTEQSTVRRPVLRIVAEPDAGGSQPNAESAVAMTKPRKRAGPAWYRTPWFASFATAAAALIAVFLYERATQVPTSPPAVTALWGWSRPGAIKDSLPRDQYLESLATAADEWFDRRPDTPQELARRIGDFRQGCSMLLLATHQPLADEDRVWLRDRCRQWANKLDGHLAAIESGGDVRTVRGEVDDTVRKLIDALRTHITEAAS